MNIYTRATPMMVVDGNIRLNTSDTIWGKWIPVLFKHFTEENFFLH